MTKASVQGLGQRVWGKGLKKVPLLQAQLHDRGLQADKLGWIVTVVDHHLVAATDKPVFNKST